MKSCLNCTDRKLGCHGECEKYRLEKEKDEQTRRNKEQYIVNYGAMFWSVRK